MWNVDCSGLAAAPAAADGVLGDREREPGGAARRQRGRGTARPAPGRLLRQEAPATEATQAI